MTQNVICSLVIVLSGLFQNVSQEYMFVLFTGDW